MDEKLRGDQAIKLFEVVGVGGGRWWGRQADGIFFPTRRTEL